MGISNYYLSWGRPGSQRLQRSCKFQCKEVLWSLQFSLSRTYTPQESFHLSSLYIWRQRKHSLSFIFPIMLEADLEAKGSSQKALASWNEHLVSTMTFTWSRLLRNESNLKMSTVWLSSFFSNLLFTSLSAGRFHWLFSSYSMKWQQLKF